MTDTVTHKKHYTTEHEWIALHHHHGHEHEHHGHQLYDVGITDHAVDQLGDVVYIELPAVGKTVKKGEACAVIESVKAASEIYAPASGTVVAVHDKLAEHPEIVNANHNTDHPVWFFRIELSDPTELQELMDEDGYNAYVGR